MFGGHPFHAQRSLRHSGRQGVEAPRVFNGRSIRVFCSGDVLYRIHLYGSVDHPSCCSSLARLRTSAFRLRHEKTLEARFLPAWLDSRGPRLGCGSIPGRAGFRAGTGNSPWENAVNVLETAFISTIARVHVLLY
jgi:hypothetical protein